jgi:hypothetical protein
MAKRCPPGVFCIENYLIVAIFCVTFVALAYLVTRQQKTVVVKDSTSATLIEPVSHDRGPFVRANPRMSYNDQVGDILLNPYAAPVNDERYLIPNQDVRGVVPINIKTQGVDSPYRQIGILTSQNSKEQILALMGRPLLTNRDQWQYYTMSERNNIKLPVSVKGKSCMNEYGCDKIYDGDTVYVEGYGNIFRATIYDNDVLRYIPIV